MASTQEIPAVVGTQVAPQLSPPAEGAALGSASQANVPPTVNIVDNKPQLEPVVPAARPSEDGPTVVVAVTQPFKLTRDDGTSRSFERGVYRDVLQADADHWYMRFHTDSSGELPFNSTATDLGYLVEENKRLVAKVVDLEAKITLLESYDSGATTAKQSKSARA